MQIGKINLFTKGISFGQTNVKPFGIYYIKRGSTFRNELANDIFMPSRHLAQKIKGQNKQDKNFISCYISDNFLKKSLEDNPKIAKLLEKKGIRLKIEPENMTKIMDNHLLPTSDFAQAIMHECDIPFSKGDYEIMHKAALLHDIGKVLIPSEILDKKGKLTDKEYEIIKLHEELGYEILKTKKIDKKILKLIGSHHNYQKRFNRSSMEQILQVADIYSALKEDRPYRKALSDKEAFEILRNNALKGDFDQVYVDNLRKALT